MRQPPISTSSSSTDSITAPAESCPQAATLSVVSNKAASAPSPLEPLCRDLPEALEDQMKPLEDASYKGNQNFDFPEPPHNTDALYKSTKQLETPKPPLARITQEMDQLWNVELAGTRSTPQVNEYRMYDDLDGLGDCSQDQSPRSSGPDGMEEDIVTYQDPYPLAKLNSQAPWKPFYMNFYAELDPVEELMPSFRRLPGVLAHIRLDVTDTLEDYFPSKIFSPPPSDASESGLQGQSCLFPVLIWSCGVAINMPRTIELAFFFLQRDDGTSSSSTSCQLSLFTSLDHQRLDATRFNIMGDDNFDLKVRIGCIETLTISYTNIVPVLDNVLAGPRLSLNDLEHLDIFRLSRNDQRDDWSNIPVYFDLPVNHSRSPSPLALGPGFEIHVGRRRLPPTLKNFHGRILPWSASETEHPISWMGYPRYRLEWYRILDELLVIFGYKSKRSEDNSMGTAPLMETRHDSDRFEFDLAPSEINTWKLLCLLLLPNFQAELDFPAISNLSVSCRGLLTPCRQLMFRELCFSLRADTTTRSLVRFREMSLLLSQDDNFALIVDRVVFRIDEALVPTLLYTFGDELSDFCSCLSRRYLKLIQIEIVCKIPPQIDDLTSDSPAFHDLARLLRATFGIAQAAPPNSLETVEYYASLEPTPEDRLRRLEITQVSQRMEDGLEEDGIILQDAMPGFCIAELLSRAQRRLKRRAFATSQWRTSDVWMRGDEQYAEVNFVHNGRYVRPPD